MHRLQQFLAGAPYRFGVVQRDASCLGEAKASFSAFEELMAETVFKVAQLNAKCGS